MSETPQSKPRLVDRFSLITPSGSPDPKLAIAASRCGVLGVLNLEVCSDSSRIAGSLETLQGHARSPFGVLLDGADDTVVDLVLSRAGSLLDVVLIGGGLDKVPAGVVERVHSSGRRAWAVATSLEQATTAQAAGVDAVICKGNESGGWVGEETAFVLFQRLLRRIDLPIHVQGGIGPSTAAACIGAGAAGVVLDSQLLLLRESPLGAADRRRLETMDGSETQVLGATLGLRFRAYGQGDQFAGLERLELEGGDRSDAGRRSAWTAAIKSSTDWRADALWVMGQDVAFASSFANRFRTVGGMVQGLSEFIERYCTTARQAEPLASDSALARDHGTRYPVVQGPMTRVSDRPEFAAEVAAAGGLPFLALALMRRDETEPLLERTGALLGDRPWGAGILGFVPPELRNEQLEAIRSARPPFVLIAGGQPRQARDLESQGISTYLHVPSPGLLEIFLDEGVRSFVFEGRECGGHIGPRTSFVLWESMIEVLAEKLDTSGVSGEYRVLFAGGISDPVSAQMVSIMAAPLVQRGVKVGVLLGTAYLFTEEAVRTGAIQSRFQRAALECTETVTLAATPGYATRCLPNPFCASFEEEKRRLILSGVSPQELKDRLEELNIGRLRIASKGVDHNPDYGRVHGADRTVPVNEDDQWMQGMYMIGQVAALRDAATTLEELHRSVTDDACELLRRMPQEEASETPAPEPADVAIVGMASILPGSPDLVRFWDNILRKVDAISEIPADRWDIDQYFDQDPNARDRVYSRWGGFIDEVPFDPLRWGMPPNSLKSIEPFQLLSLEIVRRAVEDAGYAERPMPRETTSVILGAGGGAPDLTAGYVVRSSLPGLFGQATADRLVERLDGALPEWTEDSFAGLLMNVAAGRVANRFDFGGVNYTVDAACASSLAAVYLAVRDLDARTSDVVIAGGVEAIQNPFDFFCFGETRALSPTGRSKPFDQQADGIAISEGFAALVLKRLEDAERDGDRIYAVIKGVGGSSDGRDKGLTAPRPEGQMRAFRRAYEQARVSPATLGLVEAHGTGTVAGDRAELQSLTELLDSASTRERRVAVGSVKSMIGHTKATAGVASMIKVAKALYHRVLPPTLGVSRPNASVDRAGSPIYVNTETRPWINGSDEPRRAGVSAFGFGGTNFHVVLEEYAGEYLPRTDKGMSRWPVEIFVLVGNIAQDLVGQTDRLIMLLEQDARPELADLAFTLAEDAKTAKPGALRLAIVGDSLGQLKDRLIRARRALLEGTERIHEEGIHFAAQVLGDGPPAALFPGQGSQSVDMGRELAVIWSEAQEVFDRADRVLDGVLPQPLSRFIFPPPAFTDDQRLADQAELTATQLAQPALGATELAMLAALEELGFSAGMVGGHSYGELTALHAAGVFSDEDLLRLSAARGAAMAGAAQSEGAMAAVAASPKQLEPLLQKADVVLANYNSPRQTVLSGSEVEMQQAMDWCKQHGLAVKLLPVAAAFHSPLIGGAQKSFAAALRSIELAPPVLPVYANTTGRLYPTDPGAIRKQLAGQLAKPVQFTRQVESMYADGARIFVEVGPGRVLSGLVGEILDGRPHLTVALGGGAGGVGAFLDGCAAMISEGVPLRVGRLFEGRNVRRLSLEGPPARIGQEQLPPSAWMISGAGVRPVQGIRPRTQLPLKVMLEDEVPSKVRENSGDSSPVHLEGYQALQAAERPRHQGSMKEQEGVLEHFQRVMRRFLTVQEQVMLSAGGERIVGNDSDSTVSHTPAQFAELFSPAGHEQQSVDMTSSEPLASSADPPTPSDGSTAVDHSRIRDELLSIVSDRTGYPPESLRMDAELEADLGIDSIKRVEITGAASRLTASLDGGAPGVDELAGARTLGAMLVLLSKGEETPVRGSVPDTDMVDSSASTIQPAVERFQLQWIPTPASGHKQGLDESGTILVLDDCSGVGSRLEELLRRDGYRVCTWEPEEMSKEAMGVSLDSIRNQGGHIGALVDLRALGSETALDVLDDIRPFFDLVKAVQPDLELAASRGGAAVIAVTAMGGQFGCRSIGFDSGRAWRAGFLKSLAKEWPAVRMKAVDLAKTDPAGAAARILDELFTADGETEIGFDAGGERLTCRLQADEGSDAGQLPIDRNSVVVATGGAKGITAECLRVLARSTPCTFVLLGRSPEPPSEEDPSTAGLDDEAELKRALFDQLKKERRQQPAPAQIQSRYRALMSAREIRTNIGRMEAEGARVTYIPCDSGDPDSLAGAIDRIYEEFGRIDGFVHGAGVIDDAMLETKGAESFESVLSAKVGGLDVLSSKLRADSLRFLVLFSSISGRFGNAGQVDYASANEILNKWAQQMGRTLPARVVAINWGPWAGAGMVGEHVERQFAAQGIGLIPVEEGCELFLRELCLGVNSDAEVVVGAIRPAAGDLILDPGAEQPRFPTPDKELPLLQAASDLVHSGQRITVHRTISVHTDWYLRDHVLDDTPVVPFAMATELMAEVALAGWPHLEVVEIRDIRLLNGIVLKEGSYDVVVEGERLSAGDGDQVWVAVTIRSSGADSILHYRSEVELASSPEAASRPGPGTQLVGLDGAESSSKDVDEMYVTWLFHGPLFQAIHSISTVEPRGASAWLQPSDPQQSLSGVSASDWVIDPIMVDAAFQLQVIWARENWDITVLPSNVAAVRPIPLKSAGSALRTQLVQCELRVRAESSSPISHADYWFFDEEGTYLGAVTDLQSIGSVSLNRLPAASADGRSKLR